MSRYNLNLDHNTDSNSTPLLPEARIEYVSYREPCTAVDTDYTDTVKFLVAASNHYKIQGVFFIYSKYTCDIFSRWSVRQCVLSVVDDVIDWQQ